MYHRIDHLGRRRALVAAIIAIIIGGLIAVSPTATTAADMNVTIQSFAFSPTMLTVPVGTTVVWTNRQDGVPHTTTSDAGLWDSGNLITGGTFSFRFDRAGTFAYHCKIHPEMHGTIIVADAAPSQSTAVSAPATAAQTGTMGDLFATPAFQQLWAKTDAVSGHASVWGPAPFTAGLREAYEGSPGGTRLVQYFDKGRMELTAPGGQVTAGLLTVELITGRQQNGAATFVPRAPARAPVAGDTDNSFPTYADLAQVQAAEPDHTIGAPPITKQWNAGGSFGTYMPATGDAAAMSTGYDAATRHNLPRAFVEFRNSPGFGGIGAIGLAITEPVWVQVKVGGAITSVLVQGFERRVLTYTPGNPDGFKVEYGNIGRAYHAWRTAAEMAVAPAIMPLTSLPGLPVTTPLPMMPPEHSTSPGRYRYDVRTRLADAIWQ